VSPWVGERADDVAELHDRTGPAVCQEQRYGVRFRRGYVDEVHPLPVDLGRELGQLVECRLLGTPVEGVPPVPDELVDVVQWDTAAPAEARQFVGEPGGVETAVQVVHVSLRDVDAERCDGHTHHARTRLGQILS
jgi:hypothetical protein